MQVLKLNTNEQENEELKTIEQQIMALKNRRKELRQNNKSITFAVKEFQDKKTGEVKKGIQVNGITPRPMFLYGSQALKLVEVTDQLKTFVEQNKEQLSWKEEQEVDPTPPEAA